MEEKKLEFVEEYGNLETLTNKLKIDWISNIFKKETIDGSWIENELRIINNNYGFYSNGCEWQLCEIEMVEKEETNFWGEKRIIKSYKTKHIKEANYEDIYNLSNEEQRKKIDDIIKKESEDYYKKSYNNFYYELSLNKQNSWSKNIRPLKFYTEYKDSYFSIEIDGNKSIEVDLDGLCFKADFYKGLKDSYEEEVNKQIEKYLSLNILKINNGYVYKNNYYENFEELKDYIEREEKNESGSSDNE